MDHQPPNDGRIVTSDQQPKHQPLCCPNNMERATAKIVFITKKLDLSQFHREDVPIQRLSIYVLCNLIFIIYINIIANSTFYSVDYVPSMCPAAS